MIKTKFTVFCIFLGIIFSFSLVGNIHKEAADLKAAIHNSLPEFPGWTTSEKADLIASLVLEKKPQCYVEIGVFGGSSIFPAAKTMQYLSEHYNHVGKVYAIDAWSTKVAIEGYPESNPHTQWWSSVDLQEVYIQFNLLLSRHKLFPFCEIVKGSSAEVIDRIPETIDILHIDGNPSEKVTLRDVQLYLPKVAIDGYIIVSNCLWVFEDEFTKDSGLELLFEHCDFYKSCENYNTLVFKKVSEM